MPILRILFIKNLYKINLKTYIDQIGIILNFPEADPEADIIAIGILRWFYIKQRN
jgi:hypothetical protein